MNLRKIGKKKTKTFLYVFIIIYPTVDVIIIIIVVLNFKNDLAGADLHCFCTCGEK